VRPLLLALALTISAAAQANGDPLELPELLALITAQVEIGELKEKIARDGTAFPPTPAIRRRLVSAGLTMEDLASLFPERAAPARTPIGESGLSVTLPQGWELRGEAGAWTLFIPDTPPTVRCDVVVRTWRLPTTVRDGLDDKRRVLSDLIPAQTRTLMEQGFEAAGTTPCAVRGITGVRHMLKRDRVGESPATVSLTLFSKRDRVLLIRAHTVGADDDPWLRVARASIEGWVRSVSPATEPKPLLLSGTRILARTDEGHMIVGRDGRTSPGPALAPSASLNPDPLALTAPWEFRPEADSRPQPPNRFGQPRAVEAIEDPGSAHLLCAVASDHHPVPGQEGEAASAGRLVYATEAPDPLLTLIIRTRPGVGEPVICNPRFLPSGHEVIFIDPERGLCVMPRDGGLPVVLLPGAVHAAEPWLLRP